MSKLKAACDRLELIGLRERCRVGNARSCFLLARIDPGQPVAVLERACALGSALACSDLVLSQGAQARSAEGVLARQCEAGTASSCVLLAERREQSAESGAPMRYPEAALAWKAACALGAPKGCSGFAQILAVHLHQLQPIEPGALERLFSSQCQKGIKEACQMVRRGLDLVLLRQRCSDGARISSVSSCHELAHRADPAEALDTLTRLCRDGWRDERLAPELPAGCEQGADPLVAYVESCRGGDARHCGFESLASEALARAGKECSAGTENSCALPALYVWHGVGTAREPARAALASPTTALVVFGCSRRAMEPRPESELPRLRR